MGKVLNFTEKPKTRWLGQRGLLRVRPRLFDISTATSAFWSASRWSVWPLKAN